VVASLKIHFGRFAFFTGLGIVGFAYAFLISTPEKKVHFRFSKYFSGSEISPKKDAMMVFTVPERCIHHSILIQLRMVKAAKV
jgi:hypothetical protein